MSQKKKFLGSEQQLTRKKPLHQRGIPKTSRANMPDACILCSFFLCYYIESGTILRKIATLKENGKIQGKLATRDRKSVLILAAYTSTNDVSYFVSRISSF